MPQGEFSLVQGLLTDNSNTAFTYPKVQNPKFKTYPKKLPIDNFIQRGYLRLLGENFVGAAEDTAVDALKRVGAKLNFQFNPNQLTRSVTARTDTQLWINQSPSQLLQPGIGDMTFGWQMLLNREAEVQGNEIAPSQWQANRLERDGGLKSIDALIDDYGAGSPQVAARIGVLSDIMVLDAITGQRLTQSVVDYARANFAATETVNPHSGEDPSEGMTAEEEQRFLTANMTNSAFLIPNPIRAVFSENFMVDGYVNQVTVSLQKFSPGMVPTVAFVDISMHAIYQGFARSTTVFTSLAEQIHRDTVVSDSVDPASAENQSLIANNENDEAYILQRKGYEGNPILAGFDHSPADTGANWSGMALKDHKDTGEASTTTSISGGLKGGDSLPVQVGREIERGESVALSFAVCSELRKSPLGSFLVSHPQRDQFKGLVLPRLSIDVWVGMALRARLKANSIADLRVLWNNGGEGGFADYNKTDHFFGEWSKEQRRQLFAIGLDNLHGVGGSSVARGVPGERHQETSSAVLNSGFFTRSFPITELSSHPGHYGDEFYRHHAQFDHTEINLKYGESHKGDTPTYELESEPGLSVNINQLTPTLHEGWAYAPGNVGRHISASEFKYNLAKGFYTNTTDLFPATLTLEDKDGNTINNIEYDVEYQWATTYRVRLMMKDTDSTFSRPISDTGVVWVYGRDTSTNLIDDVGDGWFGGGHEEKNKQLNGGVQGTEGSGITAAMKDGYWLTGSNAKDQELYFDDLFGSGQTHVNSKLYASHFQPDSPVNHRLGGLCISSAGVQVDISSKADM